MAHQIDELNCVVAKVGKWLEHREELPQRAARTRHQHPLVGYCSGRRGRQPQQRFRGVRRGWRGVSRMGPERGGLKDGGANHHAA